MRTKYKNAMDIALFVGVLVGLGWLLYRGSEQLGYNWQWYRVPKYLYSLQDGEFFPGPLLKGLWVTLELTTASLGLTFLFGLASALLRLSDSWVGRALARIYLELIRNTPLLVQLFIIYFVLSPVLGMGRFTAAVLALSLFEGAYASEIFRAGIVSIGREQWEAAHSLGLSTYHTYRYIILPQALRRILPPLTGIAVSLIKDSALVSTIAIADLAWRGNVIVSESFLTFEVWFTVAAIYLVLTVTLSVVVQLFEKKMKANS